MYNLTIVAESTDDICQRGRAYVVIFVSPGNMHDPVFEATTPATVREDAANGVFVATVTATDMDAGTSGEIVYSLVGGNTNDAFEVDPMTGSIFVSNTEFLNASQFDRMFSLMVSATDQGATPRSATTLQTVEVLDVNEAPYFTSPCVYESSCTFTVLENSISSLGAVNATDSDIGSNSVLSFSVAVITPPGVANPFTISNVGQLSVVSALDHETVPEYSVEVTVSDGGTPSLSAMASVTITVADVNDNHPEIIAASPIDVLELTPVGTVITTVRATDPDSGVGGVVTFRLVSNTTFNIAPDSGQISLAESLDYEMEPREYVVDVVATDGGGLSSNASILVRVLDENDNRPIFSMDKYTFAMEENLLGSVGNVSATDQDSGTNGLITYHLLTASPQFQVDPSSGEITTIQELDREQRDSFNFVVEARDGGSPRMSSRVSVCVTVSDVNDVAPAFRNTYEDISVREDVDVPSELLVVTATDGDSPGTNNSRVEYSISSGNSDNTFEVDPSTGAFRVINELDFEQRNLYTVTVTATDFGSPMRLSGSTTVRVTVIDVNDNVPMITSNFTVNVSEQSPPGSRLAQFTASDMDTGATLTYSIAGGNEDMLFSIDNSTGLVTLVAMLDYEQQTQHTLTVSVRDQSNQESFGFLTVNVINENDNRPIIQAPSDVTLEEETIQGVSAFSVIATDGDDGEFGEVTLSLTSRPVGDVFVINATGQVTVAARIDREALSQITSDDTIIVTVQAQDGGMPSFGASQEVRVRILDINDNNPAFDTDRYEASHLEEQPAGTPLSIQISASDPDLGLNGEVVFSISSNNSVPFAINSSTGAVTSTRRLDRETGSSTYQFKVIASDRGTPNRTSESIVMVTVTDLNDNSPVFSQAQFNTSIVENTTPGYNVTSVTATDADQGENACELEVDVGIGNRLCVKVLALFEYIHLNSKCLCSAGSNGEVEYGILSGNQDGTFSVDPVSGLVSTVTTTDFERMSSYDLTLFARDMGQPSLTGTTRVFVTIVNVDESPPVFDGPCNITLDEVRVETTPLPLINCTAQDYDDGRKTGFLVRVFIRCRDVHVYLRARVCDPFSLFVYVGVVQNCDSQWPGTRIESSFYPGHLLWDSVSRKRS